MSEEVEKTEDRFILGGEPDSPFFNPSDDPAEQPAGDAPEEPTKEPTGDEKPTLKGDEPSFDLLSELNKTLDASYGSIDELKSQIDASTSQEELNGLKETKEALEKKVNIVLEKYKELQDPESFFESEAAFKKSLLLKENPTLNRDVAEKIFTVDLESSNPLDIIALDIMLKHSKIKGGEAGAKEWFLRKNGIDAEDFNWDDLTLAQQNDINIAAEDAANSINTLRDNVKKPEAPKEIEELMAEWEAQSKEPEFDMTPWDGKVDDIVKNISTYEVKDSETGEVLYSEAIDEEFKEGLNEAIRDAISKGKIEPTPENIKEITAEAYKIYAAENHESIAKRMIKEMKLRQAEENHKTLHNDVDPDKINPQAAKDEGKTTNMRAFWNLD